MSRVGSKWSPCIIACPEHAQASMPGQSRCASGVGTTPCASRTNNGSAMRSRMRESAWLIADWLRASRSAARVRVALAVNRRKDTKKVQIEARQAALVINLVHDSSCRLIACVIIAQALSITHSNDRRTMPWISE